MTRQTAFRILLLIYFIAVGFLCFSTIGQPPHVPYRILGFESDKIAHFLMFFPFPLLTFYSFEHGKKNVLQTILTITALYVIGCIFAASTEFIQGFLPMRCRDINDLKADMLGMIPGSLAIFIITVIISGKK